VAHEILRKNSEIYDDTASPVWYLAVYGPVHQGWEFINLGGQEMLDRLALDGELTRGRSALELCSGQGATCRYLATRYGCAVTGVEMNQGQIANALRRLREAESPVATLVRFVQADVLHFVPDRAYDFVYSLDSLMLIDDVGAALRVARVCLGPGKPATFVTFAAGPEITDDVRSFAWAYDAMVTLASATQYAAWMENAGFAEVRVEDLTELAIRRSVDLEIAQHRNRDAIVRAAGEEVYRGWVDVGAVYLKALRERRLSYLLIGGRRREGLLDEECDRRNH
jgi:ubiquinone/menaquinone biosynthesis C-methylase UbiE